MEIKVYTRKSMQSEYEDANFIPYNLLRSIEDEYVKFVQEQSLQGIKIGVMNSIIIHLTEFSDTINHEQIQIFTNIRRQTIKMVSVDGGYKVFLG